MDRARVLVDRIKANHNYKRWLGDMVMEAFLARAAVVNGGSMHSQKEFLHKAGITTDTDGRGYTWIRNQVEDGYRAKGRHFRSVATIETQVAFLLLTGMNSEDIIQEMGVDI
jgi:hypothetical protein